MNFKSINKYNKKEKIALLFSSNYMKTNFELNGCNNDTNLIYKLLTDFFYYKKENIILLNDYTQKKLTKNNLLIIFKEIINKSSQIDTIFIYFSGHGNDNYILLNLNETLTSYEFKKLFLNNLSKNTKVIIIFDCCKSEDYICTNFITNLNFYLSNIKILFISACKKIELATEIYDSKNKKYNGIFTYYLYNVIKKYRQISWSELIYIIRLFIIKKNFNEQKQEPQIKTINCNILEEIIKI